MDFQPNLISKNSLSWISGYLNSRVSKSIVLKRVNEKYSIEFKGYDDYQILIPSASEVFTQKSSKIPCSLIDIKQDTLIDLPFDDIPAPGLQENDIRDIYSVISENTIEFNFPLVEFLVWILSRYEEVISKKSDSKGRFPYIESHAYLHNYIERPIADEWIMILREIIKKKFSFCEITRNCFNTIPTHDIDRISEFRFIYLLRYIKILSKYLLKLDFSNIFRSILVRYGRAKHASRLDRFNTFAFIIKTSKFFGLKNRFYFICGKSSKFDADYELNNPEIETLIRDLLFNGHEVGIHPSYNSFLSESIIRAEISNFNKFFKKAIGLNFSNKNLICRMHYLRLKIPLTYSILNKNSVFSDSTMYYAEYPGFRAGTCFPYFAYNLHTDESLSLIVEPLIVMDATFTSKSYLNLGMSNESLKLITKLKNRCRDVSGSFIFLWHNSSLTDEKSKNFYRKILES